MFRQLVAIFLLFAFSAQIFNRDVIMLDYYVNTGFFAKKCENKSRPMMHCNGKCQLMKKLKEEEKKEQDNPERKAENKNEVFSSKSFFATLNHQQIIFLPTYYLDLNQNIPPGIHTDIFHPPVLV